MLGLESVGVDFWRSCKDGDNDEDDDNIYLVVS